MPAAENVQPLYAFRPRCFRPVQLCGFGGSKSDSGARESWPCCGGEYRRSGSRDARTWGRGFLRGTPVAELGEAPLSEPPRERYRHRPDRKWVGFCATGPCGLVVAIFGTTFPLTPLQGRMVMSARGERAVKSVARPFAPAGLLHFPSTNADARRCWRQRSSLGRRRNEWLS